MIGKMIQKYKVYLKQYIFQYNFDYSLKKNPMSIQQLLRDTIEFKKKFSFTSNCFFCIEYYLKLNSQHFYIRHFELAFKSHINYFDLLEQALNNSHPEL
jgi:hypothetical protein